MLLVKNYYWCLYIVVINLWNIVCAVDDDNSYPKSEDALIKIKSGLLQGHIQPLSNGKFYYSFQGIPYAMPPVGDLRFKDPVPYKKWHGILNATRMSPTCIQMRLRQTNYEVFGQEDCLYLNVYTPQNPHKVHKPLPVMLWIYGGSYREGGSDIYGPEYLLTDNVLVVTFNYRTGYLGFLSTQDLNAPGNYGMKDMVLASNWVKSNIKHFGGDPDAITVFGNSAGAASVGYLLLSPLSRGLFKAAIMQSGSPLCIWGLVRNPRKVAFDLGISLGINTNSSAQLMKYLRKIDFSKAASSMVNVHLLNLMESIHTGGPLAPVVEPDNPNAFFTKDAFKAFENGDFAQIPILMGVNTQESKFFGPLLPLIRPVLFLYDVSPSLLARKTMNVQSHKDRHAVGEQIQQHYFKSGFTTGTFAEYVEYMSDDLFVRPVMKTARLLSQYVPVYFYVDGFEGEAAKWLYDFYGDKNIKADGVTHGGELFYIFKSYQGLPELKSEDKLISQRLVRLWTNFAKFSNPTPYKEELLENITWPTISGADMDYLYIGKHLTLGRNFKEKNMKFWDNLYKNYSKGPFEFY